MEVYYSALEYKNMEKGLNRKIKSLEKKILNLQAKNKELKSKIKDLESSNLLEEKED